MSLGFIFFFLYRLSMASILNSDMIFMHLIFGCLQPLSRDLRVEVCLGVSCNKQVEALFYCLSNDI